MKNYFLVLVCSATQINAMHQKPPMIINEWDAGFHVKGEKKQEQVVLMHLFDSNINLHDKCIIDVGCGTGIISKFMADRATFVMGIDPSKSMVEHAKKHYNTTNNIYFDQNYAENLRPSAFSIKFHLATAFHCLNWAPNKPEAFKKIYHVLYPNGHFLGTVATHSDSQKSLILQVFREIIPDFQKIFTFLQDIKLFSYLENAYPTDEEYKHMITDAGFDIVSFKKISLSIPFKNEDELIAMQKPIFMSKSIMRWIPESYHESLFESFMDQILKKLTIDHDGNYLYPIESTLIHAHKPIKSNYIIDTLDQKVPEECRTLKLMALVHSVFPQ